MRKCIITNNAKTRDEFADTVDVTYVSGTPLEVLEHARQMAHDGGKMLIDPTRTPAKKYYRSIPFMVDGSEPCERSIELIDSCLDRLESRRDSFAKKPLLAGMDQRQDTDTVRKVIG
ncbi:MAG: hypothetical protein VB031_07025 [Eubacteriaceae bacterium]|nr:hypothetical protein [Eubacteriaceae bacterium]